jgi:hypothetical protein
MTRHFKLMTWLMIVGLLVGGYEIIQLANGWSFRPVALGIATPMFVFGLIGVWWTWPSR